MLSRVFIWCIVSFTLVAELRALFYPTGVTDGETVWENCECSVPGKVKW